MENRVFLPRNGTPREVVLKQMEALQKKGADWHGGRTFSLVYHSSDEHTEFLKRAYNLYFHENGLNPGAFPSIGKYEAEVVAMACGLLNGSPGASGENAEGTMTSGGSESIMMAIKTYRDFYATKGITEPEVILPRTIHPAFCKAVHYFGVKPVYIPVGPDFRADVMAARRAINKNTILLVGSAPAYPHGVIDPIVELAALAMEHKISMHVDACVGGFILPFLKMLGYPIPAFDFSVVGVTSMTADLHKYGFAAKGASLVLYKNKDLRRHQFFVTQDWPGGLFASPTMTGTRPAGSIAAAWATFQALGEEGYLKIHSEIMATTKKFQDGVRNLGFEILGKPEASVFAYRAGAPSLAGVPALGGAPAGADDRAEQATSSRTMPNIYVVADLLEKKGWHVDRQVAPECIHLMITPAHTPIVDQYLKDLKEARDTAIAHPELAGEGMAAMYGMVAKVPDPTMIQQFLYHYMDQRYETPQA